MDLVAQRVKDDDSLREQFEDQEVHVVDVRRFIADILDTPPVVGIPIDNVKNDLREWAATLRYSVKLWVLRKYVEFGNPATVMYEVPEEFGPEVEIDVGEISESTMARYDVSVGDLMEAQLLSAGDRLKMSYKPRNGSQENYEATILADGSLEVLEKVFTSPSYAAVFAIQQAGSSRKTENGWTRWRTAQGESLSEVRERYLRSHVMNDC